MKYFINEFKNAPKWQKILLVLLGGILCYFFIVRISFSYLQKGILAIDNERDSVFQEVQSMRFLLEDKDVIRNNYQEARNRIALKIYSQKTFDSLFSSFLRSYSSKIYQYDHDQQKEKKYDGLLSRYLKVKIKIAEKDLVPFLQKLNKFNFLTVNKFDYARNRLVLEIEYFVNDGFKVSRRHTKKAIFKTKMRSDSRKNYRKTRIILQGFYVAGDFVKVIIGNKTYKTGDKYGKYTIIDINPDKKYIVLRYGSSKLVVRKR